MCILETVSVTTRMFSHDSDGPALQKKTVATQLPILYAIDTNNGVFTLNQAHAD